MIEQKKTYISGLLAIILLASTSTGFAGENQEPLGWGQWARNLGSNTYDYASRGAQSAWNYAKPYTPYIPAAALTGLGLYGGATQPLDNLLGGALKAGLFGAPIAATLARYYNRRSQAPEQRSSNWWDLSSVAIPAAILGAASQRWPYAPPVPVAALYGALLGGTAPLILSRYLSLNEKYNDLLNQLKTYQQQDITPIVGLSNEQNISPEIINAIENEIETLKLQLQLQLQGGPEADDILKKIADLEKQKEELSNKLLSISEYSL